MKIGGVGEFPLLSAHAAHSSAQRAGRCLNEPMVSALRSGHGVPPQAQKAKYPLPPKAGGPARTIPLRIAAI